MSKTTTRSELCWIWNLVSNAVVRVPPCRYEEWTLAIFGDSEQRTAARQRDLARALLLIVTVISLPTSRCTTELSANVMSRCSSRARGEKLEWR